MPHLRNLVILCAVVAGTIAVTAQGQRPSASLDDLLAEVRGLRAELNQAAGASIRAQLLVARLQLQEQRANTAASQLAEIRRQMLEIEQRRIGDQMEIRRVEGVLQNPTVPAGEQKGLNEHMVNVRTRIAQQEREEQRLHSQESELAAALASEQGRWLDFNARLDELERLFPTKR